MSKIVKPSSILIEQTAIQMAGTFYEVGRGQGLKSKHKTAKHYAAANFEKFIPHATDALMKILCNNSTPVEQRDMILEAFQERINDPMAMSLAQSSSQHPLPDIDVAKLIPVKELPSVIVDQRVKQDFGINPLFKAKAHR